MVFPVKIFSRKGTALEKTWVCEIGGILERHSVEKGETMSTSVLEV